MNPFNVPITDFLFIYRAKDRYKFLLENETISSLISVILDNKTVFSIKPFIISKIFNSDLVHIINLLSTLSNSIPIILLEINFDEFFSFSVLSMIYLCTINAELFRDKYSVISRNLIFLESGAKSVTLRKKSISYTITYSNPLSSCLKIFLH